MYKSLQLRKSKKRMTASWDLTHGGTVRNPNPRRRVTKTLMKRTQQPDLILNRNSRPKWAKGALSRVVSSSPQLTPRLLPSQEENVLLMLLKSLNHLLAKDQHQLLWTTTKASLLCAQLKKPAALLSSTTSEWVATGLKLTLRRHRSHRHQQLYLHLRPLNSQLKK